MIKGIHQGYQRRRKLHLKKVEWYPFKISVKNDDDKVRY